MRVLITGSIGFFGINVLRYLAEAWPAARLAGAYGSTPPDEDVRGFLAQVAERVELLPLDVADRAAFVRLVREREITHLVHAAAITPGREREAAEPTRIVDVNLGGMVNAMEAAVACPSVQRLLLVSSSGVYGAPDGDPFAPQSEDGPLRLANLYAIAKYSAELLGRRYAELTGKAIAAARFPAMYGPLERPTPSRRGLSMPQQLLQALRQRRSPRLYGPDYSSDWTHIGDAAEGVRALLAAPRWHYPVYNVSCGVAHTFRELVDAFAVYGLHADWVSDPQDADIAMLPDRVRAPLDIRRLQEDAGYAAHYDLARGVADLVQTAR